MAWPLLRLLYFRVSAANRLVVLEATVEARDALLQDELWIIDVSQSVDLDHPRSLQFLREDAAHVNAFFRRAGVATLTTRELFDFAVDPNINAANIDAAVDALIQLASSRPVDLDPEDVVAEKVRARLHFSVLTSPCLSGPAITRSERAGVLSLGVL